MPVRPARGGCGLRRRKSCPCSRVPARASAVCSCGARTSLPSGPGHTDRGHCGVVAAGEAAEVIGGGSSWCLRGRTGISPDFPQPGPSPPTWPCPLRAAVWEAGMVQRPERSGLPCSRPLGGPPPESQAQSRPQDGVGTQPDLLRSCRGSSSRRVCFSNVTLTRMSLLFIKSDVFPPTPSVFSTFSSQGGAGYRGQIPLPSARLVASLLPSDGPSRGEQGNMLLPQPPTARLAAGGGQGASGRAVLGSRARAVTPSGTDSSRASHAPHGAPPAG